MSAMTDYLEGKLGNHVLNGVSFPATTSGIVYVALFSGAVSDALTSGGVAQGEVDTVGTAYARVSVQSGWTHGPASGQFKNTAKIEFPIASGGGWGTISGVSLFDAVISGNALIQGLVTTPKTVASGDSVVFQSGQVVINWL